MKCSIFSDPVALLFHSLSGNFCLIKVLPVLWLVPLCLLFKKPLPTPGLWRYSLTFSSKWFMFYLFHLNLWIHGTGFCTSYELVGHGSLPNFYPMLLSIDLASFNLKTVLSLLNWCHFCHKSDVIVSGNSVSFFFFFFPF